MRRPVLMSLAASGAVQGLNAVTGILGARALGPGGRGELAAILVWPLALSTIGTLGVGEAVAFHASRRPGSAPRILGSALALAAVQAAALVAILAAIVGVVYARYGSHAESTALLFALAIPFNLVALYAQSLLNGLQRFARAQAVRVAVVAGLACGFATLWLLGALTVRAAALVYLGSIAGTALLALALALVASGGRIAVDRRIARDLVGFGIRSHATNVSSLANERLDQLLISLFLAPAALGLYVVAVTLSSLTVLVGASVAMVALPLVAAARERDATAARLVRFTLFASAAVTAPLLVLAPRVISLSFGHAFASGANVARLLLVGGVLLAVSRTVGAVLQGLNRPLDAGIGETLGVVVTVVALAALMPTLGLVGAGVASLLAYATGCAWNVRRAARALGLSPLRLLVPERAPRRPAPVLEAS